MKIRKIVAAMLVAGGLATTGLVGAGAAQAATSATTTVASLSQLRAADQLSLRQLLDVVGFEVRITFPNATLMVAEGGSPTGPTTDIANVTDWRLVYNTNDAAARVKSLEIHATLAGQIDAPIYHTAPWGGVVSIPDQVAMSPEQAYRILRDAGHGSAFQYVSLVKPLVAQPRLQYHFSNIRGGCDGYSVNVDDGLVQPICG